MLRGLLPSSNSTPESSVYIVLKFSLCLKFNSCVIYANYFAADGVLNDHNTVSIQYFDISFSCYNIFLDRENNG